MAKNKRDRPGKRGSLKSKLSNILIIVLAILTIGAVASVGSWFGPEDSPGASVKPKPPDSGVVVPPDTDSGTETPDVPGVDEPEEPTSVLINDVQEWKLGSKGNNNYLSLLDNYIFTHDTDFVGTEFARLLLNGNSNISISDYSQIEIELSFTAVPEMSLLGTTFYLIGVDGSGSGVRSYSTLSIVYPDEASNTWQPFTFELNDGTQVTSQYGHVKFVIVPNVDAPSLTNVKVYIDGNLVIDTVDSAFETIDTLQEIRFTSFNALAIDSAIGVDRMKVSGIPKQQ